MREAASHAKSKHQPVSGLHGLAKGRPPTIRKSSQSLSQKSTNSIINTYHALNKSLNKAQSSGDKLRAENLKAQLDSLGGLETYQRASIQGQEGRRGGDSSAVLVDWLKPLLKPVSSEQKPRLLEVGALSIHNACSVCGLFDVERIDLNSQGDGITKQDFMARPVPMSTTDIGRFDVISLSLVVNFVPDLSQRGDMLRRTTKFLSNVKGNSPDKNIEPTVLPALFLVLPAPCVINSRYMTEQQLTAIMGSLGYCLFRRKQSSKLVYYLWSWNEEAVDYSKQDFPKIMLNDGRARNNFSIILKPELPNSQ